MFDGLLSDLGRSIAICLRVAPGQEKHRASHRASRYLL